MVLRHRDKELLRFEWNGLEGVRVVSVNEQEKQFLPIEMRGEATDERLWDWLRHRILPKHRQHVHYALEKLGIEYNVRSIITVSKGLSLNDVHWVADDKDKSAWAKVNLYDNPFSEILARMAFTGMGPGDYSRPKKIDLPKETSPEFTTNGMLAKCWRRIDGQIYLYKSGTEGAANTGFEPYSEFYAAQVAEALGLDHVPYGLQSLAMKLEDFHFTRHPFYNLSPDRLRKIEEFLWKRASEIVKYGSDSDSYLLLSEKSGTLGEVESAESGTLKVDEFFTLDESLAFQIKANMKADPMISRQELSDILHIPLRTIARRIKDLVDKGEIVREGGRKMGYWKVLK